MSPLKKLGVCGVFMFGAMCVSSPYIPEPDPCSVMTTDDVISTVGASITRLVFYTRIYPGQAQPLAFEKVDINDIERPQLTEEPNRYIPDHLSVLPKTFLGG